MAPKKISIEEFRIEEIPTSCTWIIVGPPDSGKSTFIENLAYYNRLKYPVAKASSATDTAYEKYVEPLFVSHRYDESEMKSFILRQDNFKGSPCINIMDDVIDDRKKVNSPTVKAMFKWGSQHWNALDVFSSQYAIDFPPEIRKSVSYVALFREPEFNEREKLYKNFGGICGTQHEFDEILTQLTGDHTCMIIKKRSQSNNMAENISWFQTKSMKNVKWSLGCEEYHKWAKDRFNISYVEMTV